MMDILKEYPVNTEVILKNWNTCVLSYVANDDRMQILGFVYQDGDVPYYKGETSWGAVEDFFDIDYATCEKLFHEIEYPSPVTLGQVVERIENFLLTCSASCSKITTYGETNGRQ